MLMQPPGESCRSAITVSGTAVPLLSQGTAEALPSLLQDSTVATRTRAPLFPAALLAPPARLATALVPSICVLLMLYLIALTTSSVLCFLINRLLMQERNAACGPRLQAVTGTWLCQRKEVVAGLQSRCGAAPLLKGLGCVGGEVVQHKVSTERRSGICRRRVKGRLINPTSVSSSVTQVVGIIRSYYASRPTEV